MDNLRDQKVQLCTKNTINNQIILESYICGVLSDDGTKVNVIKNEMNNVLGNIPISLFLALEEDFEELKNKQDNLFGTISGVCNSEDSDKECERDDWGNYHEWVESDEPKPKDKKDEDSQSLLDFIVGGMDSIVGLSDLSDSDKTNRVKDFSFEDYINSHLEKSGTIFDDIFRDIKSDKSTKSTKSTESNDSTKDEIKELEQEIKNLISDIKKPIDETINDLIFNLNSLKKEATKQYKIFKLESLEKALKDENLDTTDVSDLISRRIESIRSRF